MLFTSCFLYFLHRFYLGKGYNPTGIAAKNTIRSTDWTDKTLKYYFFFLPFAKISNMQAIYFYEGAIGRYGIQETNGQLTRLWLGDRIAFTPSEPEIKETPLLIEAKAQLDAYFGKKLQKFSLPLAPQGTDFQLKVWKLLQQIPYGQTTTYGEIATLAGAPQACRAVGRANGRNPLPIFIPCHRVIGSGNKLTGYTGGLDIKIKLLETEGILLKF